jgi:flagellar biosynthetic protein FliP
VSSGRATDGHGRPEVSTGRTPFRIGLLLLGLLGAVWLIGTYTAQPASAAPVAQPATQLVSSRVVLASPPAAAAQHGQLLAAAPTPPTPPTNPEQPKSANDGSVSVNVGTKPSQSVSILLLITVLSVAPSLLLLVTSFTKIFIVLSLTRNALGLQSVPPNQVLAGLSLFLSLFVMGPVLTKVNKLGIQPYLHGTKSRSVAWADGVKPLREFMLAHTRPQEIALMLRAGHLPNPSDKSKLELTTIIPAFVLSELRAAMIIGFVIYVPFVIIDLVVSSSLMSLGMMMLPPVSVSLPFKLLLFVLVDGWGLIITSLVQSYHTG